MVKVTHWWDDPTFRLPREFFCVPGTAHGECTVPILGGPDFETEEDWCEHYFNNTSCRGIRDEAQDDYNVSARLIYTSSAIWALFLVVIMWTALCLLQAIITMPIVQRSKGENFFTSSIEFCPKILTYRSPLSTH